MQPPLFDTQFRRKIEIEVQMDRVVRQRQAVKALVDIGRNAKMEMLFANFQRHRRQIVYFFSDLFQNIFQIEMQRFAQIRDEAFVHHPDDEFFDEFRRHRQLNLLDRRALQHQLLIRQHRCANQHQTGAAELELAAGIQNNPADQVHGNLQLVAAGIFEGQLGGADGISLVLLILDALDEPDLSRLQLNDDLLGNRYFFVIELQGNLNGSFVHDVISCIRATEWEASR